MTSWSLLFAATSSSAYDAARGFSAGRLPVPPRACWRARSAAYM
jgi:hypothetical protein